MTIPLRYVIIVFFFYFSHHSLFLQDSLITNIIPMDINLGVSLFSFPFIQFHSLAEILKDDPNGDAEYTDYVHQYISTLSPFSNALVLLF